MKKTLYSAAFSFALTLLAPITAGAACPEPTSRAAVVFPVAQAQQAFGAMDIARFESARDGVLSLLPCLSEPLSPADAARIHGMKALDAFLQQDNGSAVNSFRSAMAADPGFTLPTDVVPEGHPVRLQLQVATTLTGSLSVPLPDVRPDRIMVDGVVSSTVPTDRPAILQRLGTDGHVMETVYLPAGGALPDWGKAETAHRSKVPFFVASGVTLAGGAALLAINGLNEQKFLDDLNDGTITGDEAETKRSSMNALYIVGYAALGLGGGIGIVGLLDVRPVVSPWGGTGLVLSGQW